MKNKNTWHKLIGLIFLVNIFYSVGLCQDVKDKEITTLFDYHDSAKQNYKKPLKEAKNEINIILSTGFLVYKNFISSQDKPSCVFTPSCSEYAVEAFQKKGIFMGWLYTFDRLSRCHSFVNPTNYPLDKQKTHFYDPVE